MPKNSEDPELALERLRSALTEARSGLRGLEAKARDHGAWADDALGALLAAKSCAGCEDSAAVDPTVSKRADGTLRCGWCEAERAKSTTQLPPNPRTTRPPLTHVALRFAGKVWSLPRPHRHHHVIRLICWLDPDVDSVDCAAEDQGFLDAGGRYLTREQAEVSAEANGQIKNGKTIGSVLTSEDLW